MYALTVWVSPEPCMSMNDAVDYTASVEARKG